MRGRTVRCIVVSFFAESGNSCHVSPSRFIVRRNKHLHRTFLIRLRSFSQTRQRAIYCRSRVISRDVKIRFSIARDEKLHREPDDFGLLFEPSTVVKTVSPRIKRRIGLPRLAVLHPARKGEEYTKNERVRCSRARAQHYAAYDGNNVEENFKAR